MTTTRSLLWPLVSAIALVATDPAGAAPAGVSPAMGIEAIVAAPRLDRAAVAALYRRAVIAGDVAALHTGLTAIAESGAPAHRRAMALLADALIDWQRGFLAPARDTVDRAVQIEPGVEALRLAAELRDAAGDAGATALYERAAKATTDPVERVRLQVRAALLRTDPAMPDGGSPAVRRHLAEVTALLGQPGAAAVAFVPAADAGLLAPQQVLRAQWAMAADQPALARSAAWAAFRSTADPIDQRYALALLAESYRRAGDLPGLLAVLDQQRGSVVIDQVRIDTLLELGRFDAALALARAGGPALQAQVPAILDLAQRQPALIAEYRRRIAAAPHDPRSYDALAAAYMAAGDGKAAEAVYAQLLASNRGSVPVLTAAARQMIGMGLVDPALAMVRTLGEAPAALVPVQMFLFDTYRAQGDRTQALAVLDGLAARLPAASPARVDVADGYESLGRDDRALAVLTAMAAAGRPLDYDQAIHVADLAAKTGHVDDAIARLRALHDGGILPARRAYVDSRIVALASGGGRLDALGRELDARLAAGTIGAADVELLLRVREAAKDVAGVQAVVTRYAAQARVGDVERLRQLGAVYARQQDYARLNDSYRQLIRLDPREADSYRQRLIQNLVHGRGAAATPEARQRELDALLAGTRQDGGPATRAFTAGVYELAGLPDRAIADYRVAAAAAPRDGDLVSRLALLLDRQGRSAEALAMLQYQAETAADEAGLLGAVDGVVTIAARGGGDRAGAMAMTRARLRWARRLLLARIADAGANGALLSALSDVATEIGDYDLQRRAQVDALALATGDGRATLLRQLIAMSSARSGDGTGPTIGNADDKVRYGLRLLALRKPFPPDVYIDLARTLLGKGDVAAAERAFSLLEDIPGVVNSDAARGDAFAAAGYRSRALASYARGLLRSQDDIALLVKTQILRETMGEAPLANRWYWQALSRLVARQPIAASDGKDAATSETQDARWYRATLSEGLLMTWQAGSPDATAIVGRIDAMAAQALAEDAASGHRPWEAQVRLPMLLALSARIAARTGDPAGLDRVGAALDARFGTEAAFVRALALARVRVVAGGEHAAVPLPQAVADDLAAQAQALDDFGLAMALAVQRRDDAAIRADVAAAIADEKRYRDEARGDRAARVMGLRPIDIALLQGAAGLPGDAFRSLVLAPLDAAPFRDLVLFDLFRASPPLLTRLEAAAGRTLLPNDRLAALLVEHDGDPPLWLPRTGAAPDNPLVTIPQRFSVDERLALYDAYTAHQRATGDRSFLQGAIAADLLDAPLDAAQRAHFLASVTAALALEPPPRADATDVWAKLLLAPDTPAARRAQLLGTADAVAVRYPDKAYIAAFLRAWFAGDRRGALAALMTHVEAVAGGGLSSDVAPGIVKRVLGDQWRREAAAFLADPRPTPDAVERFYRRYLLFDRYGDFGGTDADRRRYLEHLVALDGGNDGYAAMLAQLLVKQNDRAALATVLAGYLSRHPDDQEAATDLQIVDLLRRDPAAAAAVARTSGVDATDADWIIQMTNRARAGEQGGVPTFRGLFTDLYRTLATEQPALPVVVAVGQRRRIDVAAGGGDAAGMPFAAFLDAATRAPGTAAAVLRETWRRSAAETPDQQEGGVSRSTLLAAIPTLGPRDPVNEPADTPQLVEALVAIPAVTDELRAELAALPPVQQQAQARLFALVAEGLVRQGRAAAETDTLLATLAAGTIDRFHLQLLVTLMTRQDRAPTPAQRDALGRAMRQAANIGAILHAQLAQAFAAAGDYATAQALVEAAASQSLFPPTGYVIAASDHVTPAMLVADLRRWRDRAAAQRAYDSVKGIQAMARQSGGVAAMDNALPALGDAS